MTAEQYTTALSSLGMDNKAAAEWLGISLRTQQRYAKSGPCGMASRAVRLAMGVTELTTSLERMAINRNAPNMDRISAAVREAREMNRTITGIERAMK